MIIALKNLGFTKAGLTKCLTNVLNVIQMNTKDWIKNPMVIGIIGGAVILLLFNII